MDEGLFDSSKVWIHFEVYLQRYNRFVLNDKLNKFTKDVLLSAKKRTLVIKKGQIFYRARIGSRPPKGRGVFSRPLLEKEMLSPPSEQTKEGRINPKGISYLYLSSDYNTAISEVRPWLDQHVSVAVCEVTRDVTIIDCISKLGLFDAMQIDIHENATAQMIEDRVWFDIDNALSTPAQITDLRASYIPTQYMAEVFKNAGYEGIQYRSSLSENGYNFALFEIKPAVKVNKVELYRVDSLKYVSKKVLNISERKIELARLRAMKNRKA